jgi:hypothetical protein
MAASTAVTKAAPWATLMAARSVVCSVALKAALLVDRLAHLKVE